MSPCILEYAGNIGDAKDPETKEEEQNHILQLVDKFWSVLHWSGLTKAPESAVIFCILGKLLSLCSVQLWKIM